MTNNDVRRDIPVSPHSVTAMHHALHHAPTPAEGRRIVKRAIRMRQMDRRMTYYSTKVRDD